MTLTGFVSLIFLGLLGLFLYALVSGNGYMLKNGTLLPTTRKANPSGYWGGMLVELAVLVALVYILRYPLGIGGTGFGDIQAAAQGSWQNAQTLLATAVPSNVSAAIAPVTTPPCATATDSTFGFEAQNPVPIGGGITEGHNRAQAYLSTLRQNGAPLAYTYGGYVLGALNSLHFYRLEGTPARTVYFDFYTFQTPLALAGMTCADKLDFGGP